MRVPPLAVIGLLLASLSITPALCLAQEQPARSPAHIPGEMNKRFSDPDVDVKGFVQHFESEPREVFTRRADITRAVGLHPGDVVADIGAGTGLFTHLFAREVGPGGTVYAVDIAPAFLKHIADQAKREGHERIIKTVKNTQDSVELPPGTINTAFICDAYHHFEHPEKMLASIHRALRPEGRLIVVDFDLKQDSSAEVKQRARSPRAVYFREITGAGFELVGTETLPGLKDHFFAVFRRAEAPPEPTSKSKPTPGTPSDSGS